MRPSFTLIGVLLLLLQQGLCLSQESRFATVRRLTAARDVLHRISEPQDLDLGPEMTRPLFSWDLSAADIMPQGQLQSSVLRPANTSDTEDVEKKDKKTRGKKKKKKKKKKKQNNNQIAVNAERDESAIMPKIEDKTAKAKKAKSDRKKKEKRRRRKEKQEKRKKQEEQRASNLVPVQVGDAEPSKKNRNKTHHKPVVNSSELVPASPSSGENDVQRFRKMSTVIDSVVESNSVPILDPLAVANNPLNTSPYDDKNEPMTSDKETELVGDLSCLQGRFLPAPSVEHAVIKYVRGSFLEAEYECDLDYKLEPEGVSKLVCKEYEWLGHRPTCVSISGANRTTTLCKGCEHLCTLQEGQPKCACYRGFVLQGSTCQDINECATMNGGCEELCHNTLGSYHCQCAPGFRLADNGKNCVDINECLLRNGHGPCQDSCENLPGSYKCSCEALAGTRLAADNHTCEDLDECSRNNAGCSHICLNTLGRAFCLCPPGFMLGSDWKTCNDIDECEDPDLQEAETCSIGCINTIGSYHCIDLQDEAIPHQPQSETGITITTTISPLTTMSNTTMISFTSTASELESTTEESTYPTTTELLTTGAFEMDPTAIAASTTEVTDDMDPTTIAASTTEVTDDMETSSTEPTTEATSTTDAWESDSETTFYTTTEQSTTDMVSATEPSTTVESWLTTGLPTETPTTEATTMPTSESTTQSSTTEVTTQEFTTMEMLTTVTSTTTEMLTTVPTTTETMTELITTTISTTLSSSTTTAPVLCPPGFKRGENNECEDVNECAIGNGGCSHTCYNSLGRAFCLCPPGYMLSNNWKTCKAMEIHTTPPPKVFVACPPGYRANSKGHCKDVDECIKQNGGCSHGCINIRGSYRCVCGRGFFLGADRRTCIKEDLDVVCPPLSTPPNGYLQCIRRVIMAGPERWRARWRRRVINHAGTVCDLRCPHGYKLQGDFHKVCDGSGKWSGPEEGTCIPVVPRAEVPRKLSVRSLKDWQSWYTADLLNYILVQYALPKPRIQCPDNIVAETEPGHEKAFVAFPQPDTNVNWFRDVISRPRWGKMLEADLRPGQWKVTFTAIDPVTHHSSSCILLITVVGTPG